MDNQQNNEKEKDSSLFNYMNSLSSIQSNSITQGLSSLSFESLTSVYTSEESCFTRQSNTYDLSKDAFASAGVNEEEEEEEEEEIKIKPPQVPKNDGNNGSCCADGEMDLQKMFDNNIKPIKTPDWKTLIPEKIEMIYDSRNESEAFSFLPQQITSNSIVVANNETESSDAISILNRGLKRVKMISRLGGEGEYRKQTLGESSVEKKRKSNLHTNAIVATHSKNKNVDNPNNFNIKRQGRGGESSSKRCNCKKSKCLKCYCDCFVDGVHCTEACSCIDCSNKPMHNDTILTTRKKIESRYPHSFSPKVTRNSDWLEVAENSNETSARHRRGCNCKKSNCLKKYCECFQGGVGCSVNCRCEGCKNEFGTKDVASETSASARYKRGCNCKKSNCLKKYCECFLGGVGCSINCRCEGCKNEFGTRDGSLSDQNWGNTTGC